MFFSRSVAIVEMCPVRKVKLGSKEFNVDCEEIVADKCGVSDAECAALGELMRSGEINRVKKLSLVRNDFRLYCLCIVCCVVIVCEG